MVKRPNIASALREVGTGRTAPVPVNDTSAQASKATEEAPRKVQPSRQQTKAITVHYPPPVRQQLKILAAEQGRTIDDMVAEALNDLFVKYRKPEIAPVRAKS